MVAVEQFTELRPLLFGVAYRMLGSVTDAEDTVQDAYIRWTGSDRSDVHSPRAYLTTIVTRLCLDRLKSARSKREVYVGPWLPEPLVDDRVDSPERATELAETLSMAFLVLLEKLSPPERAAFLLREVFDFDYPDIATALERNEAACRQLVRRARVRLHRPERRFGATPADGDRLREQFLAATGAGDLPGLVGLLASDAAVYTDHGGKAAAARRTLRGADKVARFFVGVTRKFLHASAEIELHNVNGRPGLVIFEDGVAVTTASIEVDNGRITAVYMVRNPEKLRHLRPSQGL